MSPAARRCHQPCCAVTRSSHLTSSGMSRSARIPRVLSIAGSDSGGGAGIQADLKAFAACGVHGMTAITAITAQNTVGVTAVHAIPPEVIVAQVRAVRSDIGVDAVKIGMLGNAGDDRGRRPRARRAGAGDAGRARSGDGGRVGCAAARACRARGLVELLLARCTVATPNVPEARALIATGAAGGRDAAALRAGESEPPGLTPPGSTPPGLTPPSSTPPSSRAAFVRWDRRGGGHRRASRARDRSVLRRRADRRAREASAIPTAPRTGPGARIPRCWRRGWHGATSRLRRLGTPSGAPPQRCCDGLDEIGDGAGPVDVLGIASRRDNFA